MAHLDFNFEAIPTVIPTVEPGVYDGSILEPPTVGESGDKAGTQLNVKIRIEGGPFNGITLTDGISLTHPKYMNMALQGQSKVKRLALAAGVPISSSGLDTELLAGRTIKFRVARREYEKDGAKKTAAYIEDYIIH